MLKHRIPKAIEINLNLSNNKTNVCGMNLRGNEITQHFTTLCFDINTIQALLDPNASTFVQTHFGASRMHQASK
jgi:hypothetical protein